LGEIHTEDIKSVAPPPESKYPITVQSQTKSSRMFLYLMRFAWRMIHLLPQCFTGHIDNVPSFPHTRLGLEAEDIYRAIVCFNSYKRTRQTRQTQGKADRKKGQNLMVTLPLFDQDEKVDEDVATAARNKQDIKAYIDLNDLEQGGKSSFEMFVANYARNAGVNKSDGSGVDKHISGEVKLHPRRNPPDPSHLVAVLDYIKGNLQPVLYDNRTTAINPWDADTGFKAYRRHADEAKKAEKAMEESIALANYDPDKETQSQVLEAERQLFVNLSAAMNKRSAVGPSFEEAVQRLGCKVIRPEPDDDGLIDIKNTKVMWRGINLMLWQPEGIEYIVEMLNTPIGCALLADDTGLGKTLTTFAALVEHSIRLESLRTERIRERDAALAEGGDTGEFWPKRSIGRYFISPPTAPMTC
jgi:hypothetical protein